MPWSATLSGGGPGGPEVLCGAEAKQRNGANTVGAYPIVCPPFRARAQGLDSLAWRSLNGEDVYFPALIALLRPGVADRQLRGALV